LTYHVGGVGRILEGVSFRDKPTAQVDGKADFPVVEMLLPSVAETYGPGSRRGEVRAVVTVNLRVRDNREANSLEQFFVLLDKVKDAVETDTAGAVNTNLKSLRPVEVQAGDISALDVCFSAVITLTVEPKVVERGKRRL
jgi:hypothetical protein